MSWTVFDIYQSLLSFYQSVKKPAKKAAKEPAKKPAKKPATSAVLIEFDRTLVAGEYLSTIYLLTEHHYSQSPSDSHSDWNAHRIIVILSFCCLALFTVDEWMRLALFLSIYLTSSLPKILSSLFFSPNQPSPILYLSGEKETYTNLEPAFSYIYHTLLWFLRHLWDIFLCKCQQTRWDSHYEDFHSVSIKSWIKMSLNANRIFRFDLRKRCS